ncbi:hypothetical protein RI367_008768 [Sorochytrium milnesiophthora]
MSSPTPTVTPSDASRLCNGTLAQFNSAIAEMQAADTFFHNDPGTTLLQPVAQLRTRIDVYDAHANCLIPRPQHTPFDGRPKKSEHFVVSLNNFLGLTLSLQTPTSVKVRAFGLYLGEEPCRWFGDLIAAQPHLLEDYDAYLQAFNRNYAGNDLELGARHAYHNMRQSEEFDSVEACRQSLRPAVLRSLAPYQGNLHSFAELIDAVKRVQIQREEERRAEQQHRLPPLKAPHPRSHLAVQHTSHGNNTRSADGPSATSMDVDHATTDIERLWQQLYHHGNITASWQDLPPRVRRQKFDITSGRCKYCHQTGHAIKQCPVLYQDELKISDQDYDAALLEASWKFPNLYDKFLFGQIAFESESENSSVHTSDFSDSDTAEGPRIHQHTVLPRTTFSVSPAVLPVAPAKRKSTAQADVVRTRCRDLGKDRDTTTELALGFRNTRVLCLRLHF